MLARMARGAGAAAVFAALPAAAGAQVAVSSAAEAIKLTGRTHLQFNTTSAGNDSVPASTFTLRRARIVAEIKVNDFVSGKVEPEYGENRVNLRDAWVRLNFGPGFRWTMGQFKRPFDTFQLRTSTQILMIEREGFVRGVDTCAGVGSICTLSRLSSRLEYSERDIGFMFDGRIGSSPLHYYAAVMNGAGDNHRTDDNDTKSYTGRITYAVEGLEIGAHVGAHDYVNDSTATNEYAVAFGADVDWGEFEAAGPHIRAGVMYGDNWRNLTTPEPTTFLAAQAAATYRIPVRDNPMVYAVGPLLRVSWGDPDRGVGSDDGWLVTPGVAVFLTGRNKVAANVDIWSPATGDTEYSLKVQSYLYF